jgi:hypothetical protein
MCPVTEGPALFDGDGLFFRHSAALEHRILALDKTIFQAKWDDIGDIVFLVVWEFIHAKNIALSNISSNRVSSWRDRTVEGFSNLGTGAPIAPNQVISGLSERLQPWRRLLVFIYFMLDQAPCRCSPEEGNSMYRPDTQMSRRYMLNCLLNYRLRN